MDTDTINFSHLTLLEQLGEGTFAKVFKAQWFNKTVAVKRIQLNRDQYDIEREFKQLSRANHVNIIFLHGISIDNNFLHLITEYADGGPLHNLIHGEPRIEYTLAHVINWTLQCANAVAYLHSMQPTPVIHRDLKPLNILLNNRRRCIKLGDFGLVRYLATLMTDNCGTAEYMAPEVFNGKNYTEKCDVYSMSITLWEMLSRQKPYQNLHGMLAVCRNVDKGERPPLDAIVMDCPENIRSLMANCWKGNPEERSSMNDIINVLIKYPFDYELLSL